MKENDAYAMFDVKDEIVIITGVSGSLGLEYADIFLKSGSKVAGIDIRKSKPLTLLEQRHPKQFLFVESDVTSRDSLIQSLEEITKNLGNPSVLINNAAIDSPPSSSAEENGPFETYPEKSWDEVLNVNLKSVFLCSQIFGGKMAECGKGSIINISSIYGLVSPDQSIYDYRRKNGENFFKPVAYSASKSGIYNLTKYLAAYWGNKNVRVNTLTLAGVFNHQDPEFLKAYVKRIPIKRMADINEYNGAIIFLASKASSYMTGSNMVIDGGWTSI